MSWLKQNRIVIFVVGILIFGALFFIKGWKYDLSNIAATNNTAKKITQSSTTISENEQKFIDLEKSLPRFEDYPVKVYLIPPKPKLNHESNPYGMSFWTLTENWVNVASSYNMGGHYLMDRYATGNPDLLIVDGLTGQVFHEYGSINYTTKIDSSLVIFKPFRMDCFTPYGDYKCDYDGIMGGGNPRYAEWDGKQFITLCEPVVRNWKVISCGKAME